MFISTKLVKITDKRTHSHIFLYTQKPETSDSESATSGFYGLKLQQFLDIAKPWLIKVRAL